MYSIVKVCVEPTARRFMIGDVQFCRHFLRLSCALNQALFRFQIVITLLWGVFALNEIPSRALVSEIVTAVISEVRSIPKDGFHWNETTIKHRAKIWFLVLIAVLCCAVETFMANNAEKILIEVFRREKSSVVGFSPPLCEEREDLIKSCRSSFAFGLRLLVLRLFVQKSFTFLIKPSARSNSRLAITFHFGEHFYHSLIPGCNS